MRSGLHPRFKESENLMCDVNSKLCALVDPDRRGPFATRQDFP